MNFKIFAKLIIPWGGLAIICGLIVLAINQPIKRSKRSDFGGRDDTAIFMYLQKNNLDREEKREMAMKVMIAGAIVFFLGFVIYVSAKQKEASGSAAESHQDKIAHNYSDANTIKTIDNSVYPKIKISKKQIIFSMVGGIIYFFFSPIYILMSFLESKIGMVATFELGHIFYYVHSILLPILTVIILYFFEKKFYQNKHKIFLNLNTGLILGVSFFIVLSFMAHNLRDHFLGFMLNLLYALTAPVVTLIGYKLKLFK